jgi:hypothetical protein
MTPRSTRKQLLAAISSMDRRVTIPDMVARTGLSLSEVSTALNEMAYELKADLDVTDSGKIYYRFPVDLHYRYFSNRLANFLYRIWIAIQPALMFLFQISFGLLLLVSITIVFFIMLVIQSLMSAFSGNTNEVLALIKEFFSLLKKLNLVKKINWRFWQAKTEIELKEDDDEPQGDKGFLLNCHEFLFGPEDPNRNFENEKSKAIAQLIRTKNGIILPEELAPLTGSAAEELEGAFPVLAKFHGIPGATPSGHLVYKFPEMQEALKPATELIAIENNGKEHDADLVPSTPDGELEKAPPGNVKMKTRVFANIKMDAIKPILLVAVANFLGTVFFWGLLYSVQSSENVTEEIFLLLAIYASFFLLLPAFRWISVQILNRRIKRYNEKIDKLEASLVRPDETLKLVNNEVSKLRRDEVANLSDNLAYTTTRDYLEQEADQLLGQTDHPQ